MLVLSDEKYVPRLSEIWKKCFGDEDGYIKLFFEKEYKHCKTFAHFENGEIVSVLYLLDCFITLDGEKYDGYYLYAAATDPAHRKKGLMARLIEEAKCFTENEGKAFISLVPGTEPLYEYYKKFGFVNAMYKAETACDEYGISLDLKRAAADEYLKYRTDHTKNAFHWEENELKYALSCYEYYGAFPFVGDSLCMIADDERVYEIVCDEREAAEKVIGNRTAYSPDEINSSSKKVKFGMLYPTRFMPEREWKFTDIYMNNALD